MHIVGVLAEGDRGDVGDIGVRLVLAGRHARRVAVDLALLPCLLGEVARHNIVRLPLVHEVEGDCCKLRARAALHKENGIVVGNVHEFTQQRLAFEDDGFKRLVAVRDLRHRHARAGKVQELALRLLQHAQGKRGGTCGKVICSHTFHLSSNDMYYVHYTMFPRG